MNQRLQKQTIVITGASSGIGQETAYKLARQGARLILTARRVDRLEAIKIQCEKLGATNVLIFPMDLSDVSHIDRFIHFIRTKEIIIDVLINNAGIGYAGPFVEMDFHTVEQLFNVNVLGLMYLTQKIAIQMLDQRQGQIINQASLAGKVPTENYSIYAATKAAVISFSNALRLELKDFNVDVTLVNFGPVATPFFNQIEGARKEQTLDSIFTLTTGQASKVLADAVGTDKREINRPRLLGFGATLYQIAPSFIDFIISKYYQE